MTMPGTQEVASGIMSLGTSGTTLLLILGEASINPASKPYVLLRDPPFSPASPAPACFYVCEGLIMA